MARRGYSLPRAGLSLVLMVVLSSCSGSNPERESDVRAATPSPSPTTVAAQPGTELFNRGLPTADLQIARGNQPLLDLRVEIAETQEAWALGLKGVQQLPAMAGMVFLFPAPVRGSFHMRDTLMPLDIAFWDQNMVVVDILQMTPCEREPCQRYNSPHRYVGALEVNRGLLDSKGVRVGDRVTLSRT